MSEARELTTRDEWAIECMRRQMAVVDDLASAASDPRGWLAVARQTNTYLRHLENWRHRAFAGAAPEKDAHRAALEEARRRADAELAAFDADEVEQARVRLGIRLALIGKGGAGKTVISSTLSRLLARSGRKVFAADLDTNPGLAISLGLPAGVAGLPPEAVEEHPGSVYGWQLTGSMSPLQVVERFATVAPDGVRFLGLGKIGTPATGPAGPTTGKEAAKQSVAAMVHLLLGIGDPDWDVIADLEAGPTTPFERYHSFSDDVAVVVGPAWRSAMTARRLLPMVGEGRRTTIVGNRFRDEPDHPGLAARVRIPFDPELAEAERQGLAPLDACPDSPAVAAIGALAALFVNEEVPV
jgi:CO dehydrogenase maturation factor